MSGSAEYLDVSEAARILGVSTRHVARLGEAGEIRYIARGVVDRGSVAEFMRERQSSRARAWSEETAWGAVALLSNVEVDWLGSVQLSRLRKRLRSMTPDDSGAHELMGRARSRASIYTYESYGYLSPRMKKEVISVGRRGLGMSQARRDHVDGYLDAESHARLVKKYGLVQDARGTMTLRVTGFDLRVVKRIASAPSGALAALDAAGSLDPREHGVGAHALAKHLEDFARG